MRVRSRTDFWCLLLLIGTLCVEFSFGNDYLTQFELFYNYDSSFGDLFFLLVVDFMKNRVLI